MIKRIIVFFILLYAGCWCLQQAPSRAAGWLPLAIGSITPASFVATDINFNDGCGFISTCTVALTVNPGLLIIGLSGFPQSTDVSAVTACTSSPVSLTNAATTGIYATNYTSTIWYGVVACSGLQNIVGTSTATWSKMYAAAGTISNAISNTPTSICNGTELATSATVVCSSALTIPANGFAIANGQESFNTAITSSNMTVDKAINSGTLASAFAHATSAGSFTPQMTVPSFTNSGIAAATWH